MVVALTVGQTGTAQESLRYDARGNLIERTDARGQRTLYYYDAGDRVVGQVSANSALTRMTYDQVGNVVLTRTYNTAVSAVAGGPLPAAPAGEYRETQYTYDANNRVIEPGCRT